MTLATQMLHACTVRLCPGGCGAWGGGAWGLPLSWPGRGTPLEQRAVLEDPRIKPLWANLLRDWGPLVGALAGLPQFLGSDAKGLELGPDRMPHSAPIELPLSQLSKF